MIAITNQQAALAAKAAGINGRCFTTDDIREGMMHLVDALNEGMQISSGDGFTYFLRKKYGHLYCHNGSELKGSLWTAISEVVWGPKVALEVVTNLVQLDIAASQDDDYDAVDNLKLVASEIYCTTGTSCNVPMKKIR